MGDGFHARRRGGVVATFSGFEADLLRSLASQLIELLRNEAAVPTTEVDPLEAMLDFTGPTTAPDDPVLARLFPSAYRDDEEASSEFRRFTEPELRNGKAGNAAAVIDILEEAGLPSELGEEALVIDVELDRQQAMVWMKAITDMRLALASRLDIEQGDDEFWDSLPEDDPRTHVHDIYDWLAYLQETLVHAVSR
jgi:hypothetical protein